MNRRQVFAMWAATLLAPATTRASAEPYFDEGRLRRAALEARLRGLLAGLPAPARLGRIWLTTDTREFLFTSAAPLDTLGLQSPDALLQLLRLDGDISTWPSPAQLQAQARHELQCGTTAVVDGWVLSRSELAACGLLATVSEVAD